MVLEEVRMSPILLLALSLAAAPTGDPQAVLAKARQASGGEAWAKLTSTHTKLKFETSGLKGVSEGWEDLRTGRSASRFTLGPATGAEGFDGKVSWNQDTSGQVLIEDSQEARETAASAAYRTSLAYYFPDRWPAELELLPERSEGGRHFAVLRVKPKGGRAFEMWIDSATSLIDRTVEVGAIETRTVFFSDYRAVQGVRLPHTNRSTNGEEKYDQLLTVESIELNAPLTDALFASPAPPPPDFEIAKGTSTTLPFELINNHIYVQAKINGKGPFHVLCDTGGANIVTPEVAKALGLKTEGALQGRGVGEKSEDVALAMVDTLQLGDATLKRQLFAIFNMGDFAKVEGTKTEAIVGFEIFKRLVVAVDYEKSRLTLTVPKAFKYQGKGTVVPFTFSGQIPEVEGEIDGIAGKFDLDTGSRASVDLMKDFVEKNALKDKYAPKVQGVTGWGVGGPARSGISRAKVLKLGTVTISAPVVELTLQEKGAFTNRYVAGNVGAGVLKRFNLVFDYGKQQVIFEPNSAYAKADTFDRAGMWFNEGAGGFEIIDVYAGSPAAEAGLKPGDVILKVDGKPAASLKLPALRLRLRTDAPGTKVKLLVRSDDAEGEVVLTLRDLV
jgi:hypothetical protein